MVVSTTTFFEANAIVLHAFIGEGSGNTTNMVVRGHRIDFLCMMIVKLLSILIPDHIMRSKYITYVLVHISIIHETDTYVVSPEVVIILEMMSIVILVSYVA
jgi:hypothetical protein